MPQRLGPDVIKALSYSAPNVQLPAGSRITLGGQQYYLTSQLSVALSGLTANTLYMVYVVLSAGVPALVYSVNVNSTGPAGYSVWKLVGAFIASGAATLGSFVTIEGTPISKEIAYVPTITNGGTTSLNAANYTVMGSDLFVMGTAVFTGTGAAARLKVSLPTVFTIDSGSVPGTITSGGTSTPRAGDFTWFDSGTRLAEGGLYIESTTAVEFAVDNAVDNLLGNALASGDTVRYNFRVPISGWSNTPLKDL